MKRLLFFTFLATIVPLFLEAQLLESFTQVTVNDAINRPVGIRFDASGKAYVWERKGIVHIIDTTGAKLPEPLLDISEEVGSWGDHGCLGFALDPSFMENGYYYLLYVVDRHYLNHFGTPEYHPDSTETNAATIGRITRFQADESTNFTTTIEDSRKVLLGATNETGIPVLMASHGVGSLAFGTDGTLLASTGDAGSFLANDYGSDPGTYFQVALDEGIIRPKDNIGSFRSQMVDNLCGKILRLDPETGAGISSNPFFNIQDPNSAASKVYALGLRNPFRFVVKPGSGSHNVEDGYPGDLYIGDVGGSKWEELNICDQPAMNFGHPLYEGVFEKPAFWQTNLANPDAINPQYEINNCNIQNYDFQLLIQQPLQDQLNTFPNPCDENLEIAPALTWLHQPPKIMYANKLSNTPARAYVPIYNNDGVLDSINIANPASPASGSPFSGYTSVAGLFYEGDNFPEEFRGKYFHADYAWWIRSMDFDENNDLMTVESFHNNADYILDMALNPKDGCIYYVNFHDEINRICFGGNNPPVAIAKYDVQYGASPLVVNFNGAYSYDPENTPITYLWDFGDGETSTFPNPVHTFEAPNADPFSFEVSLTVTDSLGAMATDAFIISTNNSPPQVRISSFENGDYYSINGFSILPLTAEVNDAEHEDNELTYAWTTLLKHNSHEHSEEPDNQHTTKTIIEPLGCDPIENYWYEIQLEVTDAAGLVGRDTNQLFPYCDAPFFELLSLEGYAEDSYNKLEWKTITELDLTSIDIQRITAEDGLNTIATISALGTGEDYSYHDNAPIFGYNTYRLKVYNTDGTYDFSPEVRILYPAEPELLVYPNPVRSTLYFELLHPAETIELEIFNSAGARVLSQTGSGSLFEIQTQSLATGIYNYRLKNGSASHYGTFIKTP